MPTETGRVIKRKRVNLPNGSTVDIPVITQITFLDVVEQGQEYEFHIENSAAANRDIHVATIPGGGDATDESGGGGSNSLSVERIDVWRVLDIVDRGQESFIHLDNKTIKEPPDAPPYFTTHEKTHIVKYINTPDDGNWIKSELIDRFKVLDVVEQGQEKEYFLFNPPDNTGISGLMLGTDSDGNPTVAVDPGLPDISDSSDGVDPPWRADPFQNIVDYKEEEPGTSFRSIWVYLGTWNDWYFAGDDFAARLVINNFKFTRPSPFGGLERYFPYTGEGLPVNTDIPVSATNWNTVKFPNPAATPGLWVWVGQDVPGSGGNFAEFSSSAPGYISMVAGDPIISQIRNDHGTGPSQPL